MPSSGLESTFNLIDFFLHYIVYTATVSVKVKDDMRKTGSSKLVWMFTATAVVVLTFEVLRANRDIGVGIKILNTVYIFSIPIFF